jgi:alkanesulfonate monooxygenase SsuD/methylene tetrahydromethanopterin reductase-like flavin-dependent oxidoreductase (luciferase family)
MMSSATFRTPATLAIGAAQVDQMSGGRLEVGLGAGWYQAEHMTYGIPLPPPRERLDHLDEQLAIITGLWQTPVGERFNFDGKHYQLIDAPALPRPVQQPHPPIIIGGRGPRRTPALAARYADEFNVPFADLSLTEQQYGRVRAACAASGKPQPPVFSACLAVFCGRTEAEVRSRVQRHQSATALPPAEAVTGSPDQVVDQIAKFGEVGTQRVYLRVDVDDTDHIELLGSAVLPQLTDRS